MRQRLALYLLVASILLIIGIDFTTYIYSGRYPTFFLYLNYFESAVDAMVVILTYLLLKSEIRFRTKIINMAAHDLRNPLGIVKGYSELMLEEGRLTATDRDITQKVHAKSIELLTLVDDLLGHAVIEGHRVRVHRQPLVINQLVDEVVNEFRSHAESKRQRIEIQAGPAFHVNVDHGRMKQVFTNLISNAIKYSPVESPITLTIEAVDGFVRVHVRDQGPGLSATECARIFDAFSPVKKRPTAGEGSTGIGLSIAKLLVQLNGGQLTVSSEGPGHGSTFTVALRPHRKG